MRDLPVEYICSVCGRTLIGETAWALHRVEHEDIEFEAASILHWADRG